MKKKFVLAVIGPTASGKTSAAIVLAKELDGEIVCADSMQIYKHMKIGTASPSIDELAEVPHHLYNFIDPTTDYNAALYQKDARNVVDDILSRGKVPILCGGTGLYVKAALYDMNFSLASSDDSYREKLMKLYDEHGAQYIHDMLRKSDPESAESIHPNNVKRVIRALEIGHLSGTKKSEQKQEEKKYYQDSLIIGLRHSRSELYKRIDERVDKMVAQDLEKEVASLLETGVSRENNAMQAIGYKEWLDYFEGKITLDRCVANIKSNSRHYAKRQLTWFNKMDVEWYDYNESILHNYTKFLNNIKNLFFKL